MSADDAAKNQHTILQYKPWAATPSTSSFQVDCRLPASCETAQSQLNKWLVKKIEHIDKQSDTFFSVDDCCLKRILLHSSEWLKDF